MYTDAQLRPSENQDLAGAAATTVSTNSVDLLADNRNLGRGQPMRARVDVTEAFAGGTSLEVQYVESDNSDLSSATVLATTGTIALANIPGVGDGPVMDIPLPDNTKRYVGFRYVTVGTMTAGMVSSHILSDTDYQPYLPANTGY